MPGGPAKIVETDEFIDSLRKLKRELAGPQYDSVIRTLATEVTSLSGHHAILPRHDSGYPDEPETLVHSLDPGFVLIYRYVRESENAPARILLKAVLRIQEKK